jgi:hypothetical protein
MQHHRQDRPGEIFINNPDIETLLHVSAIWKTDTAFTVDVYTRGTQFNGRKTLEAVKAALRDMLYEWNTLKYRKPTVVRVGKDGGKVDYRHYRVERPIVGLTGPHR